MSSAVTPQAPVEPAIQPLGLQSLVPGVEYPAVIGKPGCGGTLMSKAKITKLRFCGISKQPQSNGQDLALAVTDKFPALAFMVSLQGTACYLPGIWSGHSECWNFPAGEANLVYILPASFDGGDVAF